MVDKEYLDSNNTDLAANSPCKQYVSPPFLDDDDHNIFFFSFLCAHTVESGSLGWNNRRFSVLSLK